MTTLAGQSLIRHIENEDTGTVLQIIGSSVVHMDERDADGQTFLMIAAQVGHLRIIQELLRQDHIDINAVDNDNWSALLNAAKEGHEAVVKVLLQYGAIIDHKDIGGWTALMWSSYKGQTQCAQILLDHNANPNVKGEHHMSCLTWASGRGHTEVVRSLLAHGSKVNTADKYGTTPLIWACRKGYTVIVDMLLHAGASVDNAGMNSWTALLVAAKGGYTEVVRVLLEYGPNVNAVDKDGYTALTWAAKDGYIEIVKSLLQYGAYVNLPDRYGDTILIHAVKGGHLEVVKALLKKYADVDVQGVDDKTALYWSVEKGHVNVTRALANFGANVEIQNKDGDTALLKAVRSRNYEAVRLLMEKSAKVSAADKRGDTSLHIAVRGRSKRIMELLLRNPKDARLLYRPNKSGETPYQIDVSKDKSILTQVFGTRNLNAADNVRGYDLYSSTIADVLSEPSLNTPINVGLYAKWGSGKSFLTDQLKKDMSTFADQQSEPEFMVSILQSSISVLLSAILGVILWLAVDWKIGLGVGLGILLLQYLVLGMLILIVKKKDWDWSYYLSIRLQRKLELLKLLLLVIFCNQPKTPKRETAKVKFLFTNNARLASVVGEKSITTMISTLSEELEAEFGVLVTRIYRVFKPKKAIEHGRFKTICCIPYFVITILVLMVASAGAIILGYYGIHSIKEPGYTVIDSILIAIAIIVGLALIANVYTWGRIVANIVMPAKRRINKLGSRSESLKSEGFMQRLKKEVELMGHMTNCMDAFLHTHTRLVVIVDGLDSCEQEKLLQVLDALHMLFGDQGSPFVTILAVDPHIIVKGIESNAHVFFQDSSINGHDYLRNMVQLPFFLQGQMVPPKRFISQQHSYHEGSVGPESTHRHERNARQDSVITSTSSQISLNDLGMKGKKKLMGSQLDNSMPIPPHILNRQPSQSDLSRSLGKNSYFSDINPRSMKRLMNIIAVTGRLLRALFIEFSWYKLAAWVNITEQWPYRMSWMILEQEDNAEEISDKMTLKKLYDRIQEKLPASKDVEPLLEIDRNVRKLELFLSNSNPSLTVGDMRRFLACTVHVDPYLRKLIRELQQNIENMTAEYNNMGLNPLLSPKGSDIVQTMASMGYGGPANLRSRNSSGESQNQRLGGPSRVGSRASAASPMGGMGQLPGYMPWTNPMLMNQLMQQQMMGAQSPSILQQQQQQTMSIPIAKGRGPRVKMQGGLPNERLSSMSIEGVCNMLRRLEGLSPQQLPKYQGHIQENNIAGFVLMTCDLAELKQVMQMNFGDWELFKTLILMLRERDYAQSKSVSSSTDSLDTNIQSPERFSHDPPLNRLENPVEIPKPKYMTERKNSDEAINLMNQQSVRYQPQPQRELTIEDLPLNERPKPRMKRIDSLVNDVMAESSVLQGMIDMVGIQEVLTEDELEEDQENDDISVTSSIMRNHIQKPSPDHYHDETPAIDDMAKLVPKQKKRKRSSIKQQKKDYESTKKTVDIDAKSQRSMRSTRSETKSTHSSVYSVGPDEESDTASEKEIELMKKIDPKHRRRVSRGSMNDSTGEPTSPKPVFHIQTELSSESITTTPQGMSSPGSVDELNPLVTDSHRQQQFVKEDILIPIDVASTSSKLQPLMVTMQKSNDSSLHLSEQATPVLSPTSSYEFLSLRKLAQMEDVESPSAFTPVSGPSSRASSRAGSVKTAGGRSESGSVDIAPGTTNGTVSLGDSGTVKAETLRLSNEDFPIGHNDNVEV